MTQDTRALGNLQATLSPQWAGQSDQGDSECFLCGFREEAGAPESWMTLEARGAGGALKAAPHFSQDLPL